MTWFGKYFIYQCQSFFLADGATVDLEDKEGRTPLHWSAVGGRTDICGMLLDHGLDISKRDKLG